MLTKIRENLYVGDDSAGVYFESDKDTPVIIIDISHWRFDLDKFYERDRGEINDILSVIRRSVRKGYPTLVHCHGGIDRSPFIIACYLAVEERRCGYESYQEVKRLHPPTIIHDDWMSWFELP